MSDGNWVMVCVVLSHCDLCSTSNCSLKTIHCHRRKLVRNGWRAKKGSNGRVLGMKEQREDLVIGRIRKVDRDEGQKRIKVLFFVQNLRRTFLWLKTNDFCRKTRGMNREKQRERCYHRLKRGERVRWDIFDYISSGGLFSLLSSLLNPLFSFSFLFYHVFISKQPEKGPRGWTPRRGEGRRKYQRNTENNKTIGGSKGGWSYFASFRQHAGR